MESNEKKCELCRENVAKIYCLKCMSNYCDSCSKFVHEKKNNKEHKQEKIDPFLPIDTKCSNHSNIPLNLFCVEDQGK